MKGEDPVEGENLCKYKINKLQHGKFFVFTHLLFLYPNAHSFATLARSFVFWYVNNSRVNSVWAHFVWRNLYFLQRWRHSHDVYMCQWQVWCFRIAHQRFQAFYCERGKRSENASESGEHFGKFAAKLRKNQFTFQSKYTYNIFNDPRPLKTSGETDDFGKLILFLSSFLNLKTQ